MSEVDLLFVYGTLRHGCGGAEARVLHGQAEWLGRGWTSGRLYRVDWYPALVIDPARVARVIGDLFRLHDSAAALAWLDRYEECGPDFAEPQEYRRMIVEVEGESGLGTARAWAYVYARAVADMPWIKSGDWLDG